MGPLKDMEGFESQVWVIHMVMKLAYKMQIPHVHIESDNIVAFEMLVDQDEEELDEEGLTVAVQQINLLHAQYFKDREF